MKITFKEDSNTLHAIYDEYIFSQMSLVERGLYCGDSTLIVNFSEWMMFMLSSHENKSVFVGFSPVCHYCFYTDPIWFGYQCRNGYRMCCRQGRNEPNRTTLGAANPGQHIWLCSACLQYINGCIIFCHLISHYSTQQTVCLCGSCLLHEHRLLWCWCALWMCSIKRTYFIWFYACSIAQCHMRSIMQCLVAFQNIMWHCTVLSHIVQSFMYYSQCDTCN